MTTATQTQTPATVELHEWSENYPDAAPFRKFLDLIGHSDDFLGENLANWEKPFACLGYLELDLLGAALREYANDPQGVTATITALLAAEDADRTADWLATYAIYAD